MEPGEITVEGVSRRFRVHARETQTLKDLFVQRGRSAPTDVWSLHDVSLHVGVSATWQPTAPSSRSDSIHAKPSGFVQTGL